MSKPPILEHFLSVGNLRPKLKWFFKPKMFLLNFPPLQRVRLRGGGQVGQRHAQAARQAVPPRLQERVAEDDQGQRGQGGDSVDKKCILEAGFPVVTVLGVNSIELLKISLKTLLRFWYYKILLKTIF